MRRFLKLAVIVSAVVVGFQASETMAQLTAYSQDFEAPGIDAGSTTTLGDDDWLVFGAAYTFDSGTYLKADTTSLIYNYAPACPCAAPNNPAAAAFSLVKTDSDGEGVPPQGSQEVVVIADYQNADHGNGTRRLEALIFQEQTIGASDVGKTAKFSFLARPDHLGIAGDPNTDVIANAFIKTLDPGAGFSTSAKYSLETTSLGTDPNAFVQLTLSLPITKNLPGHILQFGFDNWASGYQASGVGYDDVQFTVNDSFGSYSQDFEENSGIVAANPEALNNDGWRIFGTVFDSGNNFKFNYGTFGAPNGGSAFSSVASGQAGPSQGDQYLNTFSDYNCCDLGTGTPQGHGNGTDIVESSVFQELLIGSADVGRQVEFKFDATLPSDPNAAFDPNQSFAQFFVRTLDPNNGFATTAESLLDASTLGLTSSSWTSGSVLFDIDPNHVGNLIQFGITNRSSNFNPTGIFIDNVSFDDAVFTDNADFDGDGVVTGLDFLIYQQNVGLSGQTDNSNGDANGDGVVGTADLAVFEAQYGTSPLSGAISAVPEPSTLLLGSLAIGMLMRRRSR